MDYFKGTVQYVRMGHLSNSHSKQIGGSISAESCVHPILTKKEMHDPCAEWKLQWLTITYWGTKDSPLVSMLGISAAQNEDVFEIRSKLLFLHIVLIILLQFQTIQTLILNISHL